MARRGGLLEAVQGVLVRDEQGIEMAGRDATVAQAAALPEDLRALREAMDSNSVSALTASRELPAGEKLQRPDVQLRAWYLAQRVAAFQERRLSDVVDLRQAARRAASQPLRAFARA
jgi:hypothetical protein